MGNIEKENITLQSFMWKDGNHKCEAGKLLCALTELTDTVQHTTTHVDDGITAYLKEKGLVEETESGLKLASNKEEEATQLGMQISDYIGKEFESIPINKQVRIMPSILITPVPIPCMKKSK